MDFTGYVMRIAATSKIFNRQVLRQTRQAGKLPCWPIKLSCWMLACIVVFSCLANHAFGQELAGGQAAELQRIEKQVDAAEQKFVQSDFAGAARQIESAMKRLQRLAEQLEAEQFQQLEKQFNRIATAHRLLGEKGQELDELVELRPAASGREEGTSFVRQVAPILQAKCGNCHVSGNRGQFSMSTYEILMRGPGGNRVVIPGEPDGSRLVEVIESGDMPRGGGSVSDEELALLKSWISAGAKFDGEDESENLARLTAGASDATPPQTRLQTNRAEGQVAVSFARELAPVIIENCSGCHLNAQQVRGGLNLGTFRGLLRGGDSGNALIPGQADTSLLIQKLTGTGGGNSMPPGQPLDGAVIEKFKTWINEGAPFDGQADNTSLERVAEIAIASAASHAELTAMRRTQALSNWKLAMGDITPQIAENDNLLVLAPENMEIAGEYLEHLDGLLKELARQLRSDGEPPFKGRLTVYVFGKRYDFAEFGKMVDQRELPADKSMRWKADPLEASLALQVRRATDPEELDPQLIQHMAAAWVAARNGSAPLWYADAVGFDTAVRLRSREELTKQWQTDSQAAAAGQAQPNDFLAGRLDADQAGLVGYALLQGLSRQRTALARFQKMVADGQDFEESFAKVFGANLNDFVKPPNRNRRGR